MLELVEVYNPRQVLANPEDYKGPYVVLLSSVVKKDDAVSYHVALEVFAEVIDLEVGGVTVLTEV